jgi:putative hydrolase of HD superfamily
MNQLVSRRPERTPPVESLITLSDELAELGKIDRATLLPGGRNEPDSHHSFSLALIAYDICKKYCPELDADLVVRYALVHDLLEIITGDEDTLRLTHAQLTEKHTREAEAMATLQRRFEQYPALLELLGNYEALDTPEAATVYVLDKTCTIWTHFWDAGANLHDRGVRTRAGIDTWYRTQQKKLDVRLKVQPPTVILTIFESSYKKMRKELFDV